MSGPGENDLIETLRNLDGRPATLARIYATLFNRAQQS